MVNGLLVFIVFSEVSFSEMRPLAWNELSVPGSAVFLLRCFSAMVHKLDSVKNILLETSTELCVPGHFFF